MRSKWSLTLGRAVFVYERQSDEDLPTLSIEILDFDESIEEDEDGEDGDPIASTSFGIDDQEAATLSRLIQAYLADANGL